jgi:hypothetical protein
MLVSRRILTRGPSVATVLVAVTCITVMLWRHGWHAGVGFEGRVVAPMVRADFHAKSPAIGALRADQKNEPSRAFGFQGNFFPGWNGVYRLEGIHGPDALVNPRFRELIEACGFERIWDWRLYQEFSKFPPLHRFYDVLNVRHYLDYRSNQGLLGAQLTPVFIGDLDVYRSETTWPRAFFTDRLAPYATPKDFAQLIASGDAVPSPPCRAMIRSFAAKSPPNSPVARSLPPATTGLPATPPLSKSTLPDPASWCSPRPGLIEISASLLTAGA